MKLSKNQFYRRTIKNSIRIFVFTVICLIMFLYPANTDAASGLGTKDYVRIAKSIYMYQTNDKIIHKTYTVSRLSKRSQGMGLYTYQYFCNYSNYKDSRIKDFGKYHEEHGITKSNIKKILKEMFGNSRATSVFIKTFKERKQGKYYIYPATGDFGDAGSFFFDEESAKTRNKGKYMIISGKVKVYNTKNSQYEERETYTLKYLKKKSKKGIHRLVSIKVR